MAIAILGVCVFDGHGERRKAQPQILRIEHGRIAAIGAEPELARHAERFDLGDPELRSSETAPTALPGLVDAHVHLTLDPGVADPERSAREADGTQREAMATRARAMVRAGITTARDLGGGAFRELALRDAITRGDLVGPRLLCAGQPLTTPRGHCFFWGGGAEDATGIRNVVRRQVSHGADWIKVMATGGLLTPGTRVFEAQFDPTALRTAVEEAQAHGRPVAAHCHATAGIRHSVRAGVRTIEHCSFAGADGLGSDLDADVVDEIAAREVWVSPTVNAGWRRHLPDGDGRAERGRPAARSAGTRFAERMSTCYTRLHRAGAPLVASTDAGIPGVEHHRLPEALAVFAAYAGLSPAGALRSATSESARALGLGGETGTLAAGFAADVLVVDGDPTRDLGALTRPLLVLARGRVVRGPPARGRWAAPAASGSEPAAQGP